VILPSSRPYSLPAETIARHRHAAPYAALVLAGGYEEAGDAGRFRVGPGDVLVHAPFSAHCDRVGTARAQVLDIALPLGVDLSARGRVADADALVFAAAVDQSRAAKALVEQFEPVETDEGEPADRLAIDIAAGHALAIGEWGAARQLVRETLSRQFRRLYAIDASAFRAEARARNAWRMIVGCSAPLADIAHASGHSDQAHMTRAVRALTGHPPGAWRRVTSLQDPIARAA
jgi:AraC-like DNA-binding protein